MPSSSPSSAAHDTSSLDPTNRFAFGKNWSAFLRHLDHARITEAEDSLKEKLSIDTLVGKTFLDVGSGSRLFSLAPFNLGAKVASFDYDTDSVACTQYLREKYANNSVNWTVERGSILDTKFLEKFDPADVVYAWGVLHHTGHMYRAFENVVPLVKSGGQLFISIYNDQGGASRRWLKVKRLYTNGNFLTRKTLAIYTIFRQWTLTFLRDFLVCGNPLRTWFNYGKNNRGMSAWHDVVDWVGGYPFEVAKPEEVVDYFQKNGFLLQRLKTCAGGLGCNEYVFYRPKT